MTDDRKKEIMRMVKGKRWHERLRLYNTEKRKIEDMGLFTPEIHQELISLFRV